jgi:hypothetical protein
VAFSTALGALLLLGFGESPDLSLDERAPLAMVVLTPTGPAKSTSSSDLYRIADEVLRSRTGLWIQSPEQSGVDIAQLAACELKERLSCWARSARFESGRGVPLLLVVSGHALSAGGERLTSVMIDVDAALNVYKTSTHDGDDWREHVENRIFEDAVHTVSGAVNTDRPEEVRAYFEQLFDRDLREVFEAARQWHPYGTIDLQIGEPGLHIEIDGHTVGETKRGHTTLREVIARKRRIDITDPHGRFAPITADVQLEPGESKTVSLSLVPLSSPLDSKLRTATIWGGVAAIGVGAAITADAMARAPRAGIVAPCTGGACALHSSNKLASFCELGRDLPSSCGSSVLAAPLGYSLMISGAIWALGTAWLTDDGDVPWIEIAAGIVAGSLAYGLSAALD